MQCLAIGGGDTLAQHTGVANAGGLVGHILQQTQLIGTARIHLLVPATIGIGHTAEAAVVASCTHGQIDLLHLMICGQVERGGLLAQCQLAYGFVAWRCLKDVHQIRMALAVVHELHYLVDLPQACGHKVHQKLLVQLVDADSGREKRESEREKELINRRQRSCAACLPFLLLLRWLWQ